MQTVTTDPKMAVIRPSGHFNASNASEIQQQMTKVVSQTKYNFVLVDLEQVESIDSAGLMALVHVLQIAQSLDKRFSICSISPSIRIIFELTQLDRAFEILDRPMNCETTIA